MPNQQISPSSSSGPSKDSCPHCGKSVGLSGWTLLPSRDNKRVLTCKACGGHFDLSNACKMASMLGGMVGMAVAVAFPFAWITRAGHGSKLFLLAGALVVALGFCAASVGFARATLGLEARP
jgi:hypothetical protein